MGKVKEEFGRFLEQTSMKGLPRMAKAEGVFLRTVWFVGYMVLMVLAIWLTTTQVLSYFSYSVVTVYKEINLLNLDNMVNNLNLPAFFTVTVCNLKPQPSQLLWKDQGVLSSYEYFRQVERLKEQFKANFSEAEYESSKTIFQYLNSFNGYYSQTVAFTDLPKLGYSFEDLFVECYYRVLASGGQESIPCTEVSTIRLFTNPEHFNCYILDINSTKMLELEKQPFQMSAILYLDNMETVVPRTWSESDVLERSGASLYISLPNTLPDLGSSVNLSPGFETKVKNQFEIRRRKPEPYGQCREGDDNIYDFLHQKMSYSILACLRMCMQNQTYIRCGCVSPSLHVLPPHDLKADDVRFHFCGNIPPDANMTKVAEELTCSSSMASSSREGCYMNCFGECTELKDQSVISQTKWPQVHTHVAFYNDVIKSKPYASYFSEYAEISQSYNDTGNSTATLAALNKLDLIQKNFLKFQLDVDEANVNVIEDNEAMTASTLLSQLGGTLNLYIGITAILLIEIIEFVYHIIVGLGLKKQTRMTKVKPFKECTLKDEKSSE